ncbi:MAG TPA: hypothetical protein DDW50_23155 [Firmicutes bacterium]|nr:hypothetical protein [Bacillota bacterium]
MEDRTGGSEDRPKAWEDLPGHSEDFPNLLGNSPNCLAIFPTRSDNLNRRSTGSRIKAVYPAKRRMNENPVVEFCEK